MDRGFEAMLPQTEAPQEKQLNEDFKYDITLPLFGRVFSLTIKVQKQE